MAFPEPKKREAYTSYVKRAFRYVKRNPSSVRGAYKGRGKNRKLDASMVMSKIGKKWRAHTRRRK